MPIERGRVVTLAYELRNADGEPLEEEDARMAYLHGGYGGIFPKVEEALEGKDVGHELDITLEPEDAFGEYDAELLRVEALERYGEGVAPGMEIEEDARLYTVTDVADENEDQRGDDDERRQRAQPVRQDVLQHCPSPSLPLGQ